MGTTSKQRTLTDPPRHATHLVRNRSSRNGKAIRAIAIHSTESNDLANSTDDLKGVRSWFNNPASDASSHLGIDGDGNTELWVPSTEKAWTILDLNAVTLNIEFIGRAAQPAKDWELEQLKEGAKWAAYWGRRFGIPVKRGKVSNVRGQAVVARKGIIRHSDLTHAGSGTHQDPGAGFPMSKFLSLASWYSVNGWTR